MTHHGGKGAGTVTDVLTHRAGRPAEKSRTGPAWRGAAECLHNAREARGSGLGWTVG